MEHPRITRRQVLASAAGAIAGLAVTTSCVPFVGRERAKGRAGGFKLAVCDWTIGKTNDPASLQMAKRIGLDGVQVDCGSGKDTLPLFDPNLQKQFLAEAQKQQIEITSLAIGTLNGVPYKSDPRAEQWVDQSIDVCKAMGLNVVLVPFFGNGDLQNDPKGTDVVVSRFKNIAPKAEKAGVTLGIESWLSAQQHLDIIERVGSHAVKVYYDVGNSHKAGYNIYQEIRQLGKHICEFHMKDYDGLYGKGSIDFVKVRAAIDDIGYRGWLIMEGTQMPLGVEQSCLYDAEYLRIIFPPKV